MDTAETKKYSVPGAGDMRQEVQRREREYLHQEQEPGDRERKSILQQYYGAASEPFISPLKDTTLGKMLGISRSNQEETRTKTTTTSTVFPNPNLPPELLPTLAPQVRPGIEQTQAQQSFATQMGQAATAGLTNPLNVLSPMNTLSYKNPPTQQYFYPSPNKQYQPQQIINDILISQNAPIPLANYYSPLANNPNFSENLLNIRATPKTTIQTQRLLRKELADDKRQAKLDNRVRLKANRENAKGVQKELKEMEKLEKQRLKSLENKVKEKEKIIKKRIDSGVSIAKTIGHLTPYGKEVENVANLMGNLFTRQNT